MIAGVLKETFPGEKRVALVPVGVQTLVKNGLEVLVEPGAGEAAGFPDAQYQERGAKIAKDRKEVLSTADILLQVRGLGANPEKGPADAVHMKPGQIQIGFMEPLTAKKEVETLAKQKMTAFSMELVPRITRAQSMDALSSMANLAGYKAVLLAANYLPKIFPMMMTAAGTIVAAKVFIVGAGVAGLQAIATARRLGAVVHAYDVRPAVKEQVQSLGAKFVEMELDAAAAQDKGGYAKEMGEEFYRKQRELMAKVVAESDVVITTAAVPGKKAPVLVTEEMVKHMHPGSVIVDLAAERGGNCEATEPGKVVQKHGVTIAGPLNLASDIPFNSSQTYSKNLTNFMALLVKKGQLEMNMEDEIIRESMVTRDGQVVNPRVKEALGLG
ncbi:MAG: Re/Si-specific NAD(P)(+) transhydrogenase subunit alpha [Calditrichaceae bacterium]|nr:Re/Si-specific NAD(P)(+) transhydrogenase subunit alpha [Calditrichia bacterium]NUQ42491.1 Re/Si-specific NAD(P)(+) transhydrogenase subunit alpha [Calditrichaceae bacterium]